MRSVHGIATAAKGIIRVRRGTKPGPPASPHVAQAEPVAGGMRGGTALLFLAPTKLLLLALIIVPACHVAWLSLTTSTFGRAPEFVGFANYAHVLSDPYFWRALRNTVVVVLIV